MHFIKPLQKFKEIKIKIQSSLLKLKQHNNMIEYDKILIGSCNLLQLEFMNSHQLGWGIEGVEHVFGLSTLVDDQNKSKTSNHIWNINLNMLPHVQVDNVDDQPCDFFTIFHHTKHKNCNHYM